MQPNRAAIGSNAADAVDAADAAVSLERKLAITARSDSENFGALQMNFERREWAQGYVIESSGEVESDKNGKRICSHLDQARIEIW